MPGWQACSSAPGLPAAHQFSVIVLDLAGALVEVAQGRLLPFSISLLAVGQERGAAGPDILASLGISTLWRTILLVVMPVALAVIASVALLVPISIILPVVVSLVAYQAAVIILNFTDALVKVLE